MPIYGAASKNCNLSRVMVCVDRLEHSEPIGRLISPFRREAAVFTGIIDMVTLADDFFNVMGFPQAYNKDRSFQPPARAATPDQEPLIITYMDEETFMEQHGQLATFIIWVQFRQNSTWQGTVTWKEQPQEQKFHSTLELIKCMDGILSQGKSAVDWS